MCHSGSESGDTEALTSEGNRRTDGLSKAGDGELWEEVRGRVSVRDSRLEGLTRVTVDVKELVEMCNPRLEFDSDRAFGMFWQKVRVAVGKAVEAGTKAGRGGV